MATTPTTSSPTQAGMAAPALQRGAPGAWLGLLLVVGRRLLSHLGLMLAIAAGFVVAIGIVVSIPIYAEAVGYRILREQLSRTESGSLRPPFALMYRYIGVDTGSLNLEEYRTVSTYMTEGVDRTLGLPIEQRIRYAATDKLPLYQSANAGEPLIWVNMAFATGLIDHIDVVDGEFPRPSADLPIEVLMSEELASNLGFQVGEEYLVLGPRPKADEADQRIARSVTVRIAGVWRARDPNDPYWFYEPVVMKETLFIAEESFTGPLAARNPEPVYVALWYLLANGDHIRSSDVGAVTGSIQRTTTEANTVMAGMRLDVSPVDALRRHLSEVQRLTVVLTIFSIPILGLIAYFILLVASLVVQRQSTEIAVLRSRGATRGQVLGVYLIEWTLLGLVALALGILAGQSAAVVMTWTRSFLDLQPGEPLPIEMSPEAWNRALQVLVLLIFASLIPALGAARYTIVSYKSERARDTRPPFWQRAYLDILLLIPVYYGYTLLSQRGSLSILGVGATADPFSNPLLLLAPSLYVFTLALVATRFFPVVMQIIAWVLQRAPGISAITAIRYLARTPAVYTGPVLLLILTLSLAIFTASMARTLDRHLYDQIYYDTGGDLRLYDLGQGSQGVPFPGAAAQNPTPATTPSGELAEARYLFLPVTDYLLVPGVNDAARVSKSKVEFTVNNARVPGVFIGIDRIDFARVARWRNDYASESLGALMNHLAESPESVLVQSGFAARQGLRIGDRFTIRMNDLDQSRDVPVIVAGYINLFPTVYPNEDGPFVIGNLEYAFEQQGGQYPYDVWLRLEADANRDQMYLSMIDLGLKTFERGSAPEIIVQERARPERQGFFGLLSVGFVASAFLTVLGFIFYSILSFQRRFVELGMLRAIGLSVGQLARLLIWEQALIIGVGVVAGTLIGVTASNLFIPFLQVARGQSDLIPPFLVQIAWEQIITIYLVFGAMLIAAVVVMIMLLRRMKLFQAVKLGETV